MTLELHGYRYSVYTRAARLALIEKNVVFDHVEVDPFSPPIPRRYAVLHPFLRVPTLVHDDFVLYETAAINRYVDETFPGVSLQPGAPRARGRMTQMISIVDSYGYWPMVRQVFSHRVFRPLEGETADEEEVCRGLAGSRRVLGALETLAGEGPYLVGDHVSLADLHLAPMAAYFAAAPEGAAMLGEFARLHAWWELMRRRASVLETDPRLVPGALG